MDKAERIYELEREIFYLECKDRWSSADYSHMSKLRAELRNLKAEENK
jgi:hypothetical protein